MSVSYLTHANWLLGQAKELLAQTDWTMVSEINDVKLESKSLPDICPTDCFRASGFVNVAPDVLWNEIWNDDEESNKKKDGDIIEWKLIEGCDHYKVFSQINKMPWPLWSREACCALVRIKEENTYWSLIFSVNHDKVPLRDNIYVRPIVHMAIYRFVKVDSGTHVTKIGLIDPSGYVPVSVVNAYAGKLAKPIHDWRSKY